MKISYFRNLNKNERYPTTKKYLKSVFLDFEKLDFLFSLNKKFELDSRCPKKPKIKGMSLLQLLIQGIGL